MGRGGLLNPQSLDLKILERVITDSGLASLGEPGRRGKRGTANPHPRLQLLFPGLCLRHVLLETQNSQKGRRQKEPLLKSWMISCK